MRKTIPSKKKKLKCSLTPPILIEFGFCLPYFKTWNFTPSILIDYGFCLPYFKTRNFTPHVLCFSGFCPLPPI